MSASCARCGRCRDCQLGVAEARLGAALALGLVWRVGFHEPGLPALLAMVAAVLVAGRWSWRVHVRPTRLGLWLETRPLARCLLVLGAGVLVALPAVLWHIVAPLRLRLQGASSWAWWRSWWPPCWPSRPAPAVVVRLAQHAPELAGSATDHTLEVTPLMPIDF